MDKYKRPPTDSTFTAQSLVEWRIEMFEDLYMRRYEIKEQIESGEADRSKAAKILHSIDVLLGEVEQDTLVDQWERDLEEGRIPDLNA